MITETQVSEAFRRTLAAFDSYVAGHDTWDADAVRLHIAASNLRAVGLIENPTREQAEVWLAAMQ